MVMTMRTGGQILVEALLANGADRAFCVPGESYLPLLDALYDVRDRFSLISCRHEGAAAVMAEAAGKLTDRPGLCLVTRGPGACNASIGLHTAFQDSSPMILLIGQVGGADMEREAFQEIDYRQMLGPLTKWVAQIDRVERIPEFINRAYATALSGRPGPVALALPEEVLSALSDVRIPAPILVPRQQAAVQDFEALDTLMAAARRPLLLVGGTGWDAAARQSLTDFAQRTGIPVGTSFRCQDLFDNLHRLYAGDVGIGINPALASLVRDADLILAVGPRLGEITTSGYTLLQVPDPLQTLVHVHPDPDELNRVYRPALPICARPGCFIRQCADRPWRAATDGSARSAWSVRASQAWQDWQQPAPCPGPVNLPQVLATLRAALPENAIVTNGAGNFAAWLHRYFPHRGQRSQLAPTSGAMGYGLPAALAARAIHPDRPVIAWLGDGEFQMTGLELATAAQYGLGVTVIIVDNGMWGTIRMHQERHFPGRVIGTDLINPDFAALARACGVLGLTVRHTGDFAAALDEALAANRDGRPALIHLPIDPEALSPRATLSQVRHGS
jgi:acetolactate synthase I/II/III large subunit